MTFIKNFPKNITDFLNIRVNSIGVHKYILPKQLLSCHVFQIKLTGLVEEQLYNYATCKSHVRTLNICYVLVTDSL